MTKDEALQMCLEYIETDAHERKYVRHAIKQALSAPVQEPVAKVCHDLEGHIGWNPRLIELPEEGTKLFTAAQPAPVPLTYEQITAISKQVAEGGPEDSIDRFVRAIEAHHGITKGQP
jgi:hypothetical protein